MGILILLSKIIMEFLNSRYSKTNMKNWFNFVINFFLAIIVAFIMAVFVPLLFYKEDILLEFEYPTKDEYDDLKLLSEDSEGKRSYLITDTELDTQEGNKEEEIID